jgi:murein L,D-transpeptidase YcbB/YkuD
VAEAELRFTATILTYARHAMSGRVHFSRVSPSIDYKDNFDPADAMAKIAASTDLRRTLDGFNPPHPGYKALKAKYAEMRNQTAEPTATAFRTVPS